MSIAGTAVSLSVLGRGLLIGLSVAAPVGPIGVLCIRRTLSQGWAVGLLTGLGAATADALYSTIAAFGLTAVSGGLLHQQGAVRLIGGLFLCYLGAGTIRTLPAAQATRAETRGQAGAYLSAVALTLANPSTILTFAGIFAGLGSVTGVGGEGTSAGRAASLVLGVLLGSAAWWLVLSTAVALVRARVTPRALAWVNRVSGAILVGFGLAALISLL